MREIKISGEITEYSDGENRKIFSDCGGAILIRDFILKDCGGYNIGDRVTVSINPCKENEFHYPPMPKENN